MKCLCQIVWVMLCVVIAVPLTLTASDGNFAFVHVNVVPMDQERVLADHTVIVQDGRIVTMALQRQHLTPYEALRTSTTHPMEFLGEFDEAGTIEVGKRAELVLLEANPLEEISNTRKIAGVMMQGRWLPQSELQKGLDDVAVFYETLKK